MTRSPTRSKKSAPRALSALPRRRTGGRSARVRTAVLESALAVLTETGAASFSIADVAARAGVHPTSIYRRWGTPAALALEASLAFADEMLPLQDLGSLERELIDLVTRVRDLLINPKGRALLLLGATSDGEYASARVEFWRTRLAAAQVIIARAASRGELPRNAHPTELIETVVAPLYFRALVSGREIETWPIRKAVRSAIRAAQSRE